VSGLQAVPDTSRLGKSAVGSVAPEDGDRPEASACAVRMATVRREAPMIEYTVRMAYT
jgi:hypothetical protein